MDDQSAPEGLPVELLVAIESPHLPAGAIRSGILESGRLNLVVETTLQQDLFAIARVPAHVTRENPFLSSEQLTKLDDHGLIQPGSRVAEGDVLASVLQVASFEEGGKAILGNGSWYVPSNWDGSEVLTALRMKTKGRRHEYPKGVVERIEVQLRRTIPFFVTDSLKIGSTLLRTTQIIDDSQMPQQENGRPADLVVSHAAAMAMHLEPDHQHPHGVHSVRVRRIGPHSVDVLKARNVGQYSLISATPLRAPQSRSGGILVREGQLKWLIDRGQTSLVTELVSLKWNDLQNRPALRKFAITGQLPQLTNAAPDSAIQIREYLWGLGVFSEVSTDGDCVRISLRPATDAEIRSRSFGEVKKPETLNYRTYKPEPTGLFCEKIFGLENSLVRRRRPGHIELAEPIVPIIWRLTDQPRLANRLKVPQRELELIITRQMHAFERNGELRFVDQAEAAFDEQSDSGWQPLGTGVSAIAALLKRVPREATQGSATSECDEYFTQTLAVIPPDYRPLILLESGNFATADVNDLYRRIINRNNRLRKLKELNAPSVIINNEISQLQRSVDALQANDFIPHKHRVTGDAGRPLKCLLSMMNDRIEDSTRRRVDFAGQARAFANAQVPEHYVYLPAVIFDELRLQPELPVLLTSDRNLFLSRYPNRIEGPLMQLNPGDFRYLAPPDPLIQVHRPITPTACDEAVALVTGTSRTGVKPQRTVQRDVQIWCDHSDPITFISSLVNSIENRKSTRMSSLRGISIFGTGAVHSEVDPTARTINTPHAQIPDAIGNSQPTVDDMVIAIERHRRCGCLIETAEWTDKMNPGSGRIGGLPWMPPGSRWPMDATGSPLIFIGQFPLDLVRQDRILPFDVPAGSLMTIFCTRNTQPACSSRDGSIQIHSSQNLVELAHPDPHFSTHQQFGLRSESCDTYPTLAEAIEIIAWELDCEAETVREALSETYDSRFFSATGISRIGGYPAGPRLVQDLNFVAQFCFEQLSELVAGDVGVLYLHGDGLDRLSGVLDYC